MEKKTRMIKINDQTYTYQELAQKLGMDEKNIQIVLCQPIPAGVLTCSLPGSDEDPYPFAKLEFRGENGGLPQLLAMSEQSDGYEDRPRTYLYGNGDTYIAYCDVAAESDDEEETPSSIVIGGDQGDELQVWAENRHYHWMGILT